MEPFQLLEVYEIRETNSPDMLSLICKITDGYGNVLDNVPYGSSPTDPHGVNPAIRKWLADNEGSYTILPQVVLTDEEKRAQLLPLTSRQFRLGMRDLGISKASIEAVIASIPDEDERERAEIEWEYATTFDRLNPLVVTLSVALEIDAKVLDDAWATAFNY